MFFLFKKLVSHFFYILLKLCILHVNTSERKQAVTALLTFIQPNNSDVFRQTHILYKKWIKLLRKSINKKSCITSCCTWSKKQWTDIEPGAHFSLSEGIHSPEKKWHYWSDGALSQKNCDWSKTVSSWFSVSFWFSLLSCLITFASSWHRLLHSDLSLHFHC